MAPVVSPIWHRGVQRGSLISRPPMAELEIELRWRLYVEGEHLIVGVPAEALADCISKFCASIQRSPDVILAGDLEHQMTKARLLHGNGRVG